MGISSVLADPGGPCPARNRSGKPSELAAVDATQSSEVVFVLFGEIVLLNAALPDILSIIGMCFVFAGLGLFALWLS